MYWQPEKVTCFDDPLNPLPKHWHVAAMIFSLSKWNLAGEIKQITQLVM